MGHLGRGVGIDEVAHIWSPGSGISVDRSSEAIWGLAVAAASGLVGDPKLWEKKEGGGPAMEPPPSGLRLFGLPSHR